MSHLLIVELPGGSDADILVRALADGHSFSLLTADAAHYFAQPEIAPLLDQASRIIPAGAFAFEELMPRLQAVHRTDRFDAVLCLQDLRIVETAQIAQALGLRHLSPAAAELARDKLAVRQRLADAGIVQPPCRRATSAPELLTAIAAIGLPALVKPVDGFGSQHVFALRHAGDLAALHQMSGVLAAGPGDYGLGVAARGGMVVERLLEGRMIGCDTLTSGGRHVLLGVNEKLFFPPPSFAIRGGCFTTNCGQFAEIEAYAFRLLDAIGFDHGAAHIELMLTTDGPQLIEINPRLVGARLPRLLDMARDRSIHADLVHLHLAGELPPAASVPFHAATRWVAAVDQGELASLTWPPLALSAAVQVTMHARPGDRVGPAFDNADRLACVMACGSDRAATEALAQAVADQARVTLRRAA